MGMDRFAILFGSVSRGTHNSNSDIDILLLNIDESQASQFIDFSALPKLVVNYVCYNSVTFNKYYLNGSLFLFHVFNEGRLIYGNANEWERVTKGFKVKRKFDSEIGRVRLDASVYSDINLFSNYYMSAMANFYPIIKNFCIFKLASDSIYEFDKNASLKMVCRNAKEYKRLSVLRGCYDVFYRGLSIDNIRVDPASSIAGDILTEAFEFVSDYD